MLSCCGPPPRKTRSQRLFPAPKVWSSHTKLSAGGPVALIRRDSRSISISQRGMARPQAPARPRNFEISKSVLPLDGRMGAEHAFTFTCMQVFHGADRSPAAGVRLFHQGA